MTIRSIQLTKGAFAVVDEEDFSLVDGLNWHLNPYGYAAGKTRACDGRRTVLMHRLILDAPSRCIVDHINGDRLDNRKANLRLVTKSINTQKGDRPARAGSGYRGVYRDGNKWAARARLNYRFHYLGAFDAPEEAAAVYDQFVLTHFGEHATINFPKDTGR